MIVTLAHARNLRQLLLLTAAMLALAACGGRFD